VNEKVHTVKFIILFYQPTHQAMANIINLDKSWPENIQVTCLSLLS
jgi:hypothetical protein